MSNFKDILEKLCKQKHYSSTDQMIDSNVMDANYGRVKNIIYEAVEIYTNEICKEQRHICAENASAGYDHILEEAFVDKQSILDCNNPFQITKIV